MPHLYSEEIKDQTIIVNFWIHTRLNAAHLIKETGEGDRRRESTESCWKLYVKYVEYYKDDFTVMRRLYWIGSS